MTQPQRTPALTATGDQTGDNNSAGGPSSIRAPEDRRTFGPTLAIVAGSTALDNAPSNPVNSGGAFGGRQQPSVGDEAGLRGDDVNLSFINDAGNNLTDVMAHELVVGCLVRLALGAEGETAVEVLQVLGREQARARARERLGRDAIGPMEEVVAKVHGNSFLFRKWQGGLGARKGEARANFDCYRLLYFEKTVIVSPRCTTFFCFSTPPGLFIIGDVSTKRVRAHVEEVMVRRDCS